MKRNFCSWEVRGKEAGDRVRCRVDVVSHLTALRHFKVYDIICVLNFMWDGNMEQSQSGKLAQKYEDRDHSIKTMNRGKDEPVLVLASFSLAWGYKLPPPLSANDGKKMFRE